MKSKSKPKEKAPSQYWMVRIAGEELPRQVMHETHYLAQCAAIRLAEIHNVECFVYEMVGIAMPVEVKCRYVESEVGG